MAEYVVREFRLETTDGEQSIWLWCPRGREALSYLCEADASQTNEELIESGDFKIISALCNAKQADAVYDLACGIVGKGKVNRRSLLAFLRQVGRRCVSLDSYVKCEEGSQ